MDCTCILSYFLCDVSDTCFCQESDGFITDSRTYTIRTVMSWQPDITLFCDCSLGWTDLNTNWFHDTFLLILLSGVISRSSYSLIGEGEVFFWTHWQILKNTVYSILNPGSITSNVRSHPVYSLCIMICLLSFYCRKIRCNIRSLGWMEISETHLYTRRQPGITKF